MPEVFIRFDGSLEDLAVVLRDLLNVPERNRRPYHLDQFRESLHRGGEYLLLETGGFDLHVMRNVDEAEVEERADWPFYVDIRPTHFTGDMAWQAGAAEHVAGTLRAAGIEVEID